VALLLLAFGVVAVVCHNREVEADAAEADAQQAKYTRIVREAAERPPQFEVTLVEFPLSDLDRLTSPASAGARYRVVATEIAERLKTRTGRDERLGVAALLVSTPSPVPRVRLEVQRRRAAGRSLIDLTDLDSAGRRAGTDTVEWTPSANAGALAPLGLFQGPGPTFLRVEGNIILVPQRLIAERAQGSEIAIDLTGGVVPVLVFGRAGLDTRGPGVAQ
jgi:hypothetical protein